MPIENATEQIRPNEVQQAPQLAWQPSASDYHQFSKSTQTQFKQVNQDLISGGVLTDLQFNFDSKEPVLLAQEQKQENYKSNETPNLDTIAPRQLSPEAQFGGDAGNWFRHLGRAVWHTIDAASQPGAADNLIFGNIVNAKHYYNEHNMQAVHNDLKQLANDVAHMTPEEKSKASAELALAFLFVGAKAPISAEVAEQIGLNKMPPEQLKALGIEQKASKIANEATVKEIAKPAEITVPAPKSLTDIESRDWYSAKVAQIDTIEQQMRKEGRSAKEIFEVTYDFRNQAKQQARDLMKDRESAKKLPAMPTKNEILAKYDGDYEKAIEAAKRTNSKVNQTIEEMRKRKDLTHEEE